MAAASASAPPQPSGMPPATASSASGPTASAHDSAVETTFSVSCSAYIAPHKLRPAREYPRDVDKGENFRALQAGRRELEHEKLDFEPSKRSWALEQWECALRNAELRTPEDERHRLARYQTDFESRNLAWERAQRERLKAKWKSALGAPRTLDPVHTPSATLRVVHFLHTLHHL